MQVLFFSDIVSLILCFILWPILQILAAVISKRLPDRMFQWNKGVFKPQKFEKNGKIYKSVFKIDQWKHLLPDGAAVQKSGYRKKNITDFSSENLKLFLTESCRAELGHFLAITPFWIFGLFLPMPGIFLMLGYALIMNVPCILAQRYNRPRIAKLQKKIEKRENNGI